MGSGFNLINITMLTGGALLIYSGVKGKTPVVAFRELIMQQRTEAKPGTKTDKVDKTPTDTLDRVVVKNSAYVRKS